MGTIKVYKRGSQRFDFVICDKIEYTRSGRGLRVTVWNRGEVVLHERRSDVRIVLVGSNWNIPTAA